MKSKSVFSCTQCGAQSPKWIGRCPDCGAWNTFVEETVSPPASTSRGAAPALGGSQARMYADVETEAANRWYLLIARGASGKDVRQLFERQGALVSRVLRVAVASVRLDKSLARGQFRALSEEECAALLDDSREE